MKSSKAFISALAVFFPARAIAQDGCASPCFSNTTATQCESGDWPCLCRDTAYVDSVNTCITAVCTVTNDKLGAYYSFAQICQIFGVNLTQPEETSALAVASTTSLPGEGPTDNIYSILPITTPIPVVPSGPILSRPSTAPGIPIYTTSVTVLPPGASNSSTKATESAASTLSTRNPGGPISSSNLSTTASGVRSTSTLVITEGATGTGGAGGGASASATSGLSNVASRVGSTGSMFGSALIGFAFVITML